jgi:hypothetical protein
MYSNVRAARRTSRKRVMQAGRAVATQERRAR